jgi:hypothetical protein
LSSPIWFIEYDELDTYLPAFRTGAPGVTGNFEINGQIDLPE